MEATRNSRTNIQRQVELTRRMDGAIDEACRLDWHGEIVIRIKVQAGTLQEDPLVETVRRQV